MNTPTSRFLALVLALALAQPLPAQVPQLLNYQGRVAVGTVNFDGTGQFKFALVNSDGTTTYWSNDGSSTIGDEPGSAVALPVAKGLYSVLLGDASLANMTAVPASVFTHPDVRLRVWFDDGVNGSQLLAPDQRIAAVGYAMIAGNVQDGAITSSQIAPGAITGDRLAPATLDATNLFTLAPPAAGQVLTFDGTNLAWVPAAGGGGDSVFSLNGTSAYYNAGNVGIGTSTPAHRLSLAGGPYWTSNNWLGAMELANVDAIAWRANAGGQRFGMGHTNGGFGMWRTIADPGTTAWPANYDLFINDSGNVGINGSPVSKLHIIAGYGDAYPPRVESSGPHGFTSGWDFYHGATAMGYIGVPDSIASFAPNELLLLGGGITPISLWPGGNRALTAATNGNVGIGTASPQANLHISNSASVTEVIETSGGTNAWAILQLKNANGLWNVGTSRNYNGDQLYFSRNGAAAAFAVQANGDAYSAGTISCKVLTIRGGADLAEPFAMSQRGVPSGAVVVIDAQHPGKLRMSDHACDKRVAGIVSGANGINPGISMIQEDTLEAGENVALSGRVYVNANASAGSIEPGDLLTTSDIPGEAMKAADHSRAQGAILGKAMTSLSEGNGTVLVLVTLQ